LVEIEPKEIGISEKLVTKWVVAARIINNSRKGSKAGKTIFSGLSKAGKTSIVYSLKSITHTPKVTTGLSQDYVKLAGNNVQISDMGGQSRFREIYLLTPEMYFARTKLLFYVIDIQEKETLGDSLEYLERVLSIYRYLREKPYIAIFFHKYDPDMAYTLKYDIPAIEERIENIFQRYSEFTKSTFRTSIFNPPSIFLAISSTLSKVFPVMSILSELLRDFAEMHGFDGLLLMDGEGMLIGQYLPEVDTNDILESSYDAYSEVKDVQSFTPIVLKKETENPPGEIVIQQIFLPHNKGYIIYWTRAENDLDLTEFFISEITKTLNPWLYNLLAS
ncbi:MAG: ADP-ribosylation factor-like protein, partial [Candidatus Heimdallarchaeaceae archaeon]